MVSLIDLSHEIEDGMETYRPLPGPKICDFWTREQSRAHYVAGTEFHIGQITMVANTGTYLDSPFHRYADGADLAGLPLETLADLPGVVVRVEHQREIGPAHFDGLELKGCAVLVQTGWSKHWRTEAYFEGHPFLTEAAAQRLADAGARLVGIDSLNIDATSGGERPVHSLLLHKGIPIVEHLCGLEKLPKQGFRFHAVPPKVVGMGTFPVRAFALVSE